MNKKEGMGMNVYIFSDAHFFQVPTGEIFTDSVYDREFFARYLTTFEQINVVGRLTAVKSVDSKMLRVDSEKIHVLPLPNFYGAIGAVKYVIPLMQKIHVYLGRSDLVILRGPGTIPFFVGLVYFLMNHNGKVLGMEVIGDPWTLFEKGVNKYKFSFIARYLETFGFKFLAKKSNGVSYVTNFYLQSMYPCQATIAKRNTLEYFTASYSSIILPDDSISTPRVYKDTKCFKIVHVAANYTNYAKGHVTVIRAVKELVDHGYEDVCVTFIGDGPLRREFEKLAEKIGVKKYITFIGKLANAKEVKKKISNSDMMVFPTASEGLPRVLLEAMSEGLPCLSSPVCGIPEILKDKYLFDHQDYKGFAREIAHLLNSPDELTQMSRENIKTAESYIESKLKVKRDMFYESLRDLTLFKCENIKA